MMNTLDYNTKLDKLNKYLSGREPVTKIGFENQHTVNYVNNNKKFKPNVAENILNALSQSNDIYTDFDRDLAKRIFAAAIIDDIPGKSPKNVPSYIKYIYLTGKPDIYNEYLNDYIESTGNKITPENNAYLIHTYMPWCEDKTLFRPKTTYHNPISNTLITNKSETYNDLNFVDRMQCGLDENPYLKLQSPKQNNLMNQILGKTIEPDVCNPDYIPPADLLDYIKDQFNKTNDLHQISAEKTTDPSNFRNYLYPALGLTALAGLGYGGYKYYQYRKQQEEERNKRLTKLEQDMLKETESRKQRKTGNKTYKIETFYK